jgi:hypothetical protein
VHRGHGPALGRVLAAVERGRGSTPCQRRAPRQYCPVLVPPGAPRSGRLLAGDRPDAYRLGSHRWNRCRVMRSGIV